MAIFAGRLTGREAYLRIRVVPKVALNSVREKAVVSLVPIGRGQEENMKSLSSYLNIDLVHVESALSLRQYCYVNVRRLHVQSALRALNDQMTVDFEERSKHKLQSSKFNREEVEPIIRAQVKDALAIQNPIDRENTVCNLILVEAQKFSIANQLVGTLSEQKNCAYDKLLETFVVPYLCQKADIYLELWGTGLSQSTTTTTSAPISSATYSPQIPPPGGHDLDTQTRSNYRNNAKKIYSILKNSNDPRVVAFLAKVRSMHPTLTDGDIADNFGLAIALLNNCKHGVLANDPEVSKLINPDSLVTALRKWSALKDNILLDVVKCFEEVTS